MYRDARHLTLLFSAQRSGDADGHLCAQNGQTARKAAPLGGAAEHDRLQRRYPRGVTIRPEKTRVLLLPM